MYLPIHHNDTQISTLPVSSGMVISWELMGAKEIRADIETPGVLLSPIGSYIEYQGERYTINTPPILAEVINNHRYRYSLVFESDLYRLYDKGFKHLKNNNFQYYGTASDYVQLLVDNINEIDSGWSVGTVDVTEEKKADFTPMKCRAALDTIAELFAFEWNVTGKTIHLQKQVGNLTTHVFAYGRGKGLYKLSASYQSDKNIVTRAFGYGSTRNLPPGYRNGAKNLMFEGDYLDRNTELYRVKEGDYNNEDIFPERDAPVTAVSFNEGDNTFTITDTTLDFDINAHLLEGNTAKVSFKTGELQGEEFEILRYNHATKTITCKVSTDSNSYTLPNGVFSAHVGDVYTLLDISLPQTYVDDAEARLRAKTQKYLDENCIPRVLYSLELDPLYARDNSIMLKPGDKVRIQHAALGIDDLIRVSSISYPLNFPETITQETKITVEIANFIPYTISERVIADTIDNQKEIKVVDRRNAERARLNSMNMKQLAGRVFDPDGNLAKGQESLYAAMGTFGFASQNYVLNNVTINPNAGGDQNTLTISAGQLIHYFYEIESLGYIWNMEAAAFNNLDPAKFYYAYAKCSKTSLQGTWELSETPVGTNDIPGFWAFNLGQLFEVNLDGYRNFDFTKGMTFIVGDQITTGRIQDITKQNFFDLTSGSFNLGNEQYGIDWNVTTEGRLTIRGFVIADDVSVGSNGVINAGLSGDTTLGLDSIVIWSGGTKETATFKVNQRGELYAVSGYIGGFKIGSNSLESAQNYGASGKFVLYPNDGYIAFIDSSVGYWAGIGANIFPATAGVRGVGRFENMGFSGSDNYGVVITAKNGVNNYSLLLTGNIRCMENTAIEGLQVKTQVVNGSYTVTTEGAIIVITNNATITLPANPSDGRVVSINRTDTTVLRVSGNGKGVKIRDVYTVPGALTENLWGATFTYSSFLGYWVATGFLP